MKPRISVIMPVYNTERYLSLAVNSILTQTYEDFEFLIFDDGSTDKSVAIVEQYQRRDPRIRFCKNEHRGYVAWLNEGLHLAQGEFVARMDSDDISLPLRFERQIEYLDTHPDCVAVGCRALLIDSAGEPIAPSDSPVSHEEIDARHMAGGGGTRIPHPSVMMRKSAVLKVGGYRAQYHDAEDLDLFLRLAEDCGKLANLPEILLQYRLHAASVGVSRRKNQLAMIEAATREAYERRELPVPHNLADKFPRPGNPSSLRNWVISAALKHGHWKTARRHALAAWVRRPWSIRAWKRAAYASFRRGAW